VLEPAGDFVERFLAALDDDFNTAAALGLTSELLTLANRLLDQPKLAAKDLRRRTLVAVKQGLAEAGIVLGVFGQDPALYLLRRRERICARRGLDAAQIEARIAQRFAARQAKDFALADQLRQELTSLGLELMDGATGTGWRFAEE
jgi:cysteinyl-tRNA synthetase